LVFLQSPFPLSLRLKEVKQGEIVAYSISLGDGRSAQKNFVFVLQSPKEIEERRRKKSVL
jgi:hypothetical protein